MPASTAASPASAPSSAPAKGSFIPSFCVCPLIVLAFAVLVSVLVSLASPTYVVHDRGVVIVTGASTGLGRHAVEFIAKARPGLTVLAAMRKEGDYAELAALKLPNVRHLSLDVTSASSRASAMATVAGLLEAEQLPLVGLINNAGVSRGGPLEFHALDDIRSVFEVNVFGLVGFTQLALPHLRAAKGRIVMVSSVAGRIAPPTSGAYSASKFALEAVSDALRRELLPFGCPVAVVEPAYTKSAIFNSSVAASVEAVDPQAYEVYKAYYTPERAAARAWEIAHASDPIVVSEAMLHALTSAQPQTRYVVATTMGLPASVLTFVAWLLPDRIVDLLAK